jgi:hypothetical protein
MKALLIAAALALMPAAAHAATAQLAGQWNITLTTPQGALPVTCILTQTGTTLGGTCGGGGMEAATTTGTVTESNFTLTYDVTFSGTPLHVVYTGALQADGTVSGSFAADPYAGTFAGARVAPAAPAPAAPHAGH